MAEFPELLDLVHNVDTSFSTLRATIRNWHDEERYAEAFRRRLEEWERRLLGEGWVGMAMGGCSSTSCGADDQGEAWPDEIVRLWF